MHEGRSERAGHIAEMSAALAEGVDRLLALGGDGSLREAAAGLLASGHASRVALGVLPLGTGNVVARRPRLPGPGGGGAGPGSRRGVAHRRRGGPERRGGERGGALPRHGRVRLRRRGGRAGRPRALGAGSFGAGWYRRSADTLYGCVAARDGPAAAGAVRRGDRRGRGRAERRPWWCPTSAPTGRGWRWSPARPRTTAPSDINCGSAQLPWRRPRRSSQRSCAARRRDGQRSSARLDAWSSAPGEVGPFRGSSMATRWTARRRSSFDSSRARFDSCGRRGSDGPSGG